MEAQPWSAGVVLLVLYCFCRVNSNILSTMLDAPQAIDDEELKEILNTNEVPQNLNAVKMDNGRENKTSTRRLHTLKTLTTTSTEGEGYIEALLSIDALEDSEKKYQRKMRRLRKKLRRQNKKNKAKNKKIRKKRFTFDDEINPDWLWPNGVIHFQFDSSLSDKQKENILYVMEMYNYYTPVSFVETSEGDNLLFGNFGGCWSSIGRRADSQQISPCANNEATIIHEIGHAIGLYHEHQNPAATSYLWPNDEALSDDWIQWFYPVIGDYFKYYSHVFDLDSPMMYSPWDASKSRTNLDSMVVFDEEHMHAVGNRGDRQTMYYVFKEISELYGVASEMCTDLVCDFDGYPAYMDGVCMCDCPTGLDSFSQPGCSAIEVEDMSGEFTDWPQDVVLVQFTLNGFNGCPVGFLGDGWFHMGGGPNKLEYDSIYNFNGVIEPGSTVGVMNVHLCIRDNSLPLNNVITWPKGSYCYIKDGLFCPAGFFEGTKKFNSGGAFGWYGNVPQPSGIYSTGDVTYITWCCRKDAHHTVPALFPIDTPFILFPSAGKCQVVKGMDGAWQMVKYYNNGDKSDVDPAGLLPTMNIDGAGNIILNLCFYTRITTDCGELYYLNASNRQVTFSTPNYPENYRNSERCTWVFKTEPGNFFKLEFHDFDIATNPDGTTNDEVEIRNFKIGNNGVRYTGQGIARHHISEENYLSVIFYSSNNNPARGFQATVTLVNAETSCYSGKGENYDGKRNVTVYFKPCLNWKDAADKGCPHHPYAIGDEFDSLDHNYCRNPGHGVRPWCYVDYNDACYREYCDVCNLRGCFDGDNGQCDVNLSKIRWCEINKEDCKATCNCDDGTQNCAYVDVRSDCQETVDKLPKFCDSTEGQTYCADTCGVCDRIMQEPLVKTCSPPSIHDAEVVNEKPSYNLGEVAELRCKYGNGTHSQTCSSTGNWVPKLDFVCDAQCPEGYELVGGKCYKVYKQVEFLQGKQLCEGDGAQMLTMKSDSSAVVSALYEHFSDLGVYHFWLDMTDSASNDEFVWGDGTELTYTNWRSKPLKLTEEYRQKYISNTFSTRSMTKTGKPCLYWDSAEVQNISSAPSFSDNYCRVFDRSTPYLYCYFVTSDGEILREDCDHMPFYYDDYTAATTPFPRELNRPLTEYTGQLSYGYFGQMRCLNWKLFNESFTDNDFPENNMEDAKNYCRRPLSDRYDVLSCYVSSSGLRTACNNPAKCSKDHSECRTYRRFYGGGEKVHYAGTVNYNNLGNECINWTSTAYGYYYLFPSDGFSASDASNYCRPVYDTRPWCFDVTGSWGYCIITEECCYEQGYTRPSDYMGTRSFSWNEEKCLRWDSVPNLPYTDDDFPDGSVANASNFCRAPDGGDYLFCYVNFRDGPQWCDVPMDQNTRDCAYLDFMTRKWIPTYCDDVHDVVCEKPEEELYRECSDSDETSCRELFEANPEKCKDINFYWGMIRCRKTCGYCSDNNPLTTNTDTCTEPVLDSSVTKVTAAISVAVGDYFEYSCPNGTRATGNLKRGCLPDQTLTGINPLCIDNELVNEWTSNVSMIERSYSSGNGTLWFGTSKKNTIQKNGYLTGWSYYSLNDATFAFYVLRKNANSNRYSVVNYTVIENVQSYRSAVFDLEPQNQFPVQSGDHIAWLMVSDMDKTGGIPYDRCVATYFPDDYERVRQLLNVDNVHEPASFTSFLTGAFRTCRIYSFAARVGPNDWV